MSRLSTGVEATAIEIKGLKKNYGKIEALKGIDLSVEKGIIFGIIGANGAGKSTMIKILVGSSNLSGGSVRVLGLNPFKDAALLRANIGYMPQAPALYEDLSAQANIAFFGAAHQLSNLKKQVAEVLEFTLLSERKNDPVYSYSGGMKQRVSLACALVHEPQVLFLDEPTAGVDPKLRETFWQHFRHLADKGTTLFISTHMMDEAVQCDKVAIMREGVVLVSDTPKNIMLLGNSAVKIIRGNTEEVFKVTNLPSQLPVLLRRFHLDSSITRIELEEDSLETIVLNLINGKTLEKPQEEAING
ncbi:MAG: ABC transporter ATP-binding protein [Chloroflexota bacterium]|nr:ABC transporter ATP-binding protein [Chloroflexota bacterium]